MSEYLKSILIVTRYNKIPGILHLETAAVKFATNVNYNRKMLIELASGAS
jgi:hypothetical protein